MHKIKKYLKLLVISTYASCCVAGQVPAVHAVAASAGTQNSSITQSAFSTLEGATTIAEYAAAMQSFFNQYSVTVSTTCDNTTIPNTYPYTCTSLDQADLADAKIFSKMLIEEWSKYPPEWITLTDLNTIILADDYGRDGNAIASAPYNTAQAMLYDATYSQAYLTTYVRREIHHEYDHYVEYFQSGNTTYSPADSVWSGYNPAGFSYGTGGNSCYATPPPDYCSFTGAHPPGFVTAYSRSGIEEDKAEIYAQLFSTAEYATLQDWMIEDPILVSKVAKYKAFIKSIVPSMDDNYFASIHGYFASGHPDTGYTASMVTKELTGSSPTTVLTILENRTIILNGVRGQTTVYNTGFLKGSGTVGTLQILAGGHLAPGNSPGCISAGNTTLAGNFDVELGGTSACTGYDQLQVTGTVDVSGGTLNLSRFNNFAPATGQTYTIITNDGVDAVTGTFAGLSQGATVSVDGYTFTINYTGGDGNDIVLSVTGVPPVVPGTPNTGLGLLMANPLLTLLLTLISAGGLFIIARKYKSKPSAN